MFLPQPLHGELCFLRRHRRNHATQELVLAAILVDRDGQSPSVGAFPDDMAWVRCCRGRFPLSRDEKGTFDREVTGCDSCGFFCAATAAAAVAGAGAGAAAAAWCR